MLSAFLRNQKNRPHCTKFKRPSLANILARIHLKIACLIHKMLHLTHKMLLPCYLGRHLCNTTEIQKIYTFSINAHDKKQNLPIKHSTVKLPEPGVAYLKKSTEFKLTFSDSTRNQITNGPLLFYCCNCYLLDYSCSFT